jgi:hypothetical protein
VEEVAPALLTQAIWNQVNAQVTLPTESIGPDIIQVAVAELLPPEWAGTQASRALDALFDFLETGDPTVASLEIDAEPFVAQVRGAAGQRAVLAALQELPTCTATQEGFSVEAGGFLTDICMPPDAPLDQAAGLVHAATIETLDLAPELLTEVGSIQVPLLGTNTLGSDGLARMQTLRQAFLVGRQRAWMLWFVPLWCLLAIWVLVVRSVGDLGFWWGWLLLIAGIITAFLTFLLPPFATATLLVSMTGGQNAGQAPLGRLLSDTLNSIFNLWLPRVLMQAGMLLMASIPLIAISYIKGSTRR